MIDIITQDYSSIPCAELVINTEEDSEPFGCAEVEMRSEFFDHLHQAQVELLQGWISCLQSLLESVEAGDFQEEVTMEHMRAAVNTLVDPEDPNLEGRN